MEEQIGTSVWHIVQRERWPGEYVGSQRVTSVPLVTVGQTVAANQPILRLERLAASTGEAGNIERRDEVVPAGLNGRVTALTPRGGVVLESSATTVSGTLGVGNQVAGVLTAMHVHDESDISGAMSKLPAGAILAIPERLTFTLLRRAVISGVVGIIGGSIALNDLEGFLRVDLLSLLDSPNIEQAQAHLPAITIMLTGGMGHAPMAPDTFEQLQHLQGEVVLLSGVTSTRYHRVPELLISSHQQQASEHALQTNPSMEHSSLSLGMRVRVCCEEQEDVNGRTGRIEYFFTHEQLFPSGIMSRAVRLRLDNGPSIMVPLMHIQHLENI